MMGSQDLIFAPSDGLEPGMPVEISLAWPRLLDNRVRLEVMLTTTITGCQDGVAEARIWAFQFRTRKPAEAEPRTEQGGLRR
jgi:hypothetical protein